MQTLNCNEQTFFTKEMLKELFRGIAWNIDDPSTLRNFALSYPFAHKAVKEFTPYKKKQFTTVFSKRLSTGSFRRYPILPNGFIHGDMVFSAGKAINRYNTGHLICQISENTNTQTITQYQVPKGEHDMNFLTKHFIVGEQSDDVGKLVRIEPIHKPSRIHCFYCPLCKWYHFFEFWDYNFITNTLIFYYVFSDCDDRTRNVRLRYVKYTNQCQIFHYKVTTRLKIASKVIEFAKQIRQQEIRQQEILQQEKDQQIEQNDETKEVKII